MVAMAPSVDQRTPPVVPDAVARALAWPGSTSPRARRPPRTAAVVVATLVALAGSLAADAVLVAIGTAVFPSTQGYGHFAFGDYARLTTVGVLIACAGWPIVARISSAARWLFLRLAVAVTLVLFLPDAWILLQGAPAKAVAVLLAMHVAIAVVTYTRSSTWPRSDGAGPRCRGLSGPGRRAATATARRAAALAREGSSWSGPLAPAGRWMSMRLMVRKATSTTIGIVMAMAIRPSPWPARSGTSAWTDSRPPRRREGG